MVQAYRALLAATIHSLPAQNDFEVRELQSVGRQATRDWEADTARVRRLFDEAKTGRDLARHFDLWRKEPPSMVSLLAVSADVLNLDVRDPVLRAAMLAAVAADIPLANGYHDNHHFREVTAMMAVYCRANQKLAVAGLDGAFSLSAKEMAKCLLAAISHDLLHDGKGNTVDGVHTQYRLENRAIAAIRPFMQHAGMADVDCEDVAAMIRVTDVSAPKGATSPHKTLRKLITGAPANIPPGMMEIALDERLRYMAALLSDADLTPSAGLTYAFSRAQGRRLAAEVPAIPPTDESQLGFLVHVLEGSFLSPAARHLTQPCLNKIQAQTADKIQRKQAKKPI